MNKTKIEWVKNPDGTQGYTWNPITGCLNGCEYCYARKLANTRLRERYLANKNTAPPSPEIQREISWSAEYNPFYPRFWKDRLLDLRTRKPREQTITKPRGIFVCDMSDLFGIGIPESWTNRVLDAIKTCPQHCFYLLTKQPQNLPQWSPFPDNCWVGVSAWNVESLNNACHYLGMIEAKLRYISFEPLLDRIDLTWFEVGKIAWVIIGAQTKPYKPPKIEWVREIVQACDKVGVKVFLKGNLYPLLGLGNGQSICHNNDVGTLRQEMPNE